MTKAIAIGGDHAGYQYKEVIKKALADAGWQVTDHGPFAEDSVDYPDFVHPVARDVADGRVTYGILICGSGNGVAMTANKYQQVRCGLCWTVELAALTRQHNNANILALPARFVSLEDAQRMVDTFISTDFEGGRHERRVCKITEPFEIKDAE